ncbi:MAG TPA: nucleotide exchange factor GrpE [Streptosporangiaceae bacterium]|jgi:molecular chaperone GrpE
MAGRDKGAPEAGERQGPVVRDRRRVDPETGEVREPTAESAPDEGAEDAAGEPAAEPGKVQELTADLQRVTAEYANYRKRVDRDRVADRVQAVSSVLTELLPMIDDIGRARDHGELTGGFKQVAEALESAVTKLGLVRYGEKGDPFDPNIHEALTHMYSPDVTETTCVEIFQPGYKVGERILRPARVVVAEPGGDAADGAEAEGAEASGGPEEQ